MKINIFGRGVFIGSTKADLLKDTTMNCVFLSAHDISNAIEGFDVVMQLVSTTLPKRFNNNLVYDVKSNSVYLSIWPNHGYPSHDIAGD